MKQRVAIARALANDPAIILMDEPFGALDAQTREVLQDELARIQRVEHKTILFVTHSIREAVYLADRVVVMTSAPGRIKQVFPIKLPEVRDRFAPEFTQYESDITRVVQGRSRQGARVSAAATRARGDAGRARPVGRHRPRQRVARRRQPGAAAHAGRGRPGRARSWRASGELAQHSPHLAGAGGPGLRPRRGWPRSASGCSSAMCVPLRLMTEPVIEFVRPIPPLAFLPMFLVWFGLGEASKIAFIGYTTFFPMFVAIAASVLRVDVVLLRAAASLGASRADLVRRVVLPAALPGIVVALRVGVGLALFVIVGAEFMGADAGLGHLIMEGRTFFNPAQIVLGALVLGLLGSLINTLLLAAERRLLRWRAAA